MYMRKLTGQGATEYLVLLAVVLIVALVAIALLSSGGTSDSMYKESELYWQGANPISIASADAFAVPTAWYDDVTNIKLVLKNNGPNTIIIRRILTTEDNCSIEGQGGSDNGGILYARFVNYPTHYTIAPGGTLSIGTQDTIGGFWNMVMAGKSDSYFCSECLWGNDFSPKLCSKNVQSVCKVTGGQSGFGTLTIEDFGFEYTEQINGVEIVKTQYGSKPLIIRCTNPQ
jgi:hypothetical protein